VIEAFEQWYDQGGAALAMDLWPESIVSFIQQAITDLSHGRIRMAEPLPDWHCHGWVKKAILSYFRMLSNQVMHGSTFGYDKVPSRYSADDIAQLEADGIRLVPPAHVRMGSYVAPGCVVMPSFINIGAYVGENTMIDTWATVGSGAQVGKNVHLSGGAGLGGVLEPIQARPTIVEDDCFIGGRCQVAEGVIVRRGAVLAAGVVITASTPIVDVKSGAVQYGEVPQNTVVIPGTMPMRHGQYHSAAALIVKQRCFNTDVKTQLESLLRH